MQWVVWILDQDPIFFSKFVSIWYINIYFEKSFPHYSDIFVNVSYMWVVALFLENAKLR